MYQPSSDIRGSKFPHVLRSSNMFQHASSMFQESHGIGPRNLQLLVQLCHAKTLQIWVERDLGEVLAAQEKLSQSCQNHTNTEPDLKVIELYSATFPEYFVIFALLLS